MDYREMGSERKMVSKDLVTKTLTDYLADFSCDARIVRARLYQRPGATQTIIQISCETDEEDFARREAKFAMQGWVQRYMRGKQSYGAATLKGYEYNGSRMNISGDLIYKFCFSLGFAGDYYQLNLW